MKRNFILTIGILFFNLSYSQIEGDYLKKYPFNKAVTIFISSFQNTTQINDTLVKVSCREIPKINNKVNFAGLEEMKKLYPFYYTQLSKIIFEKRKDTEKQEEENLCSESGYAILFCNNAGEVFEYIYFCYNCRTVFSSFKESSLNDYDYEKFTLLKDFFKENNMDIRAYR